MCSSSFSRGAPDFDANTFVNCWPADLVETSPISVQFASCSSATSADTGPPRVAIRSRNVDSSSARTVLRSVRNAYLREPSENGKAKRFQKYPVAEDAV